MKLLIASDIHGDIESAEILINVFNKEKCDKIVLLGDILYHGPRNDLPGRYAPKEVISLLNKYKDRILAVRGNCDTEVDQMVLDFPVLADYALLYDASVTLYATHGHVYNPDNPPPLANGSVLLCGHTHVTKAEKYEHFTYINPGSVSIPKENTSRGYVIYESGRFDFYDLDGNKTNEYMV